MSLYVPRERAARARAFVDTGTGAMHHDAAATRIRRPDVRPDLRDVAKPGDASEKLRFSGCRTRLRDHADESRVRLQ